MYQPAIILDARSNLIRVAHPDLPAYPKTTLSADVLALGTSLTVGDNSGFANADYLVIGTPGDAQTENPHITAAVVAGTALTTSALVFNHPIDTPVLKTLWNQVEISGAATITGTKTVLGTVSVTYGMPDTEYVVTGTTYAYYFARFKNSTTAAFSSYSDAAPAAGYDPDTVRMVKKTALNLTGEKIGTVITDDFLNTEVTNCEVDIWKEKRRWAMFDVNDYVIGYMAPGVVSFPLPADISDPDTNEAVRSVRVRQIGQLRYVDQEEYDALRWDMAFSTLSIAAHPADTVVSLVSVADYFDEGTVFIGGDAVTYTGRDTTLNQLTGVDGSTITSVHAIGSVVWQGGQRDMAPTVYTVKDRAINLVLPPSISYVGQGLYLSYYSKPTYPNSDAALIEWPDPIMYHYWLAWKIDLKRHDGSVTDAGTGFREQYDLRKQTLLSRARLQDTPKFVPRRPFRRQDITATITDEFVSWVIR